MGKIGFKVVMVAAMVAVFGLGWASAEDDKEVSLDRIVVTPSRFVKDLGDKPIATTVIDSLDIQESGAQTVVDLLRPSTGVVVRDLYGNGVKAMVDVRGFGDTAQMNSAVLVDGRKVNAVDNAGVDWTQIPLNQVERIEITRGGNSVLYGDNAVGAVVNIITKKGKGTPKFKVGAQVGSYDANTEALSFGGEQSRFSYMFNLSRQGTHGYRNNSFYKAKDFSTKLEYGFTDMYSLHFSQEFHQASYGLPGGLNLTDLQNFSRRFSKYGADRATDKDYYFLLGGKGDFGKFGKFVMDVSYRIKDTKSNLIGGNGGWNPIKFTYVETLGIIPKYTRDEELLGHKNNFTFGFDFYRNDYSSDNFNAAHEVQDMTDIRKISSGGYLQDELFLTKNLSALGGFRYESVTYEFDYHDNSGYYGDVDQRVMPNRKAYNAGLSYKYMENSNIYININQSFRFPSTDEFFTGTLNTSLKPQTSRNFEIGVRQRFSDFAGVDLSVYRMKLKDELFTDPTAAGGLGATSNYDKTQHQGIDISGNLRPIKPLEFFASYSYSDPTFRGGIYAGKRLPMVPADKANFGIRFLPFKWLTVNLVENYTGETYRINDVTNNQPRMKRYYTTDLGVAYNKNELTVSLDVKNIFNKYYYEYATYGASSGNKINYPSPGTNFSLRADYKF
jgi:iron complex outermembrane receptor protein